MKGGTLIYKCRRCGKRYGNTHVPDALEAITSINVEGHTPNEWGPMSMSLTDVHACDDNNYGIADFIGAEADEP